ncbi:hypothetical protein E2C01_051598 [Portunus trituberculatus]|uniref:Uncharacterized protein n=1 Tax=Portunus trituberculatus TaxID=210409 RepID=A0A5B7GF83_PORTR|nr:hypothetical protein [Portunus trituberculatus]
MMKITRHNSSSKSKLIIPPNAAAELTETIAVSGRRRAGGQAGRIRGFSPFLEVREY